MHGYIAFSCLRLTNVGALKLLQRYHLTERWSSGILKVLLHAHSQNWSCSYLFTFVRFYGILLLKIYAYGGNETCPYPSVDREEAPAAESALTSKERIPLVSLY